MSKRDENSKTASPAVAVAPAVVVTEPIARSVDRVWEVVSDLEAQPKWMTDALEVRVTTGRPYGVGTKAIVPTKIAGFKVQDKMTVTEWDEGRRIAVRHRGVVTGVADITLEPLGDELTLVRWTERLELPWGLAGRVLMVLFRPLLRAQFAADLRRLRSVVQGDD